MHVGMYVCMHVWMAGCMRVFFSACLFSLSWSSAILAGEQSWQRVLRAGLATNASKSSADFKGSILG